MILEVKGSFTSPRCFRDFVVPSFSFHQLGGENQEHCKQLQGLGSSQLIIAQNV